jgi:hypothetical protein
MMDINSQQRSQVEDKVKRGGELLLTGRRRRAGIIIKWRPLLKSIQAQGFPVES